MALKGKTTAKTDAKVTKKAADKKVEEQVEEQVEEKVEETSAETTDDKAMVQKKSAATPAKAGGRATPFISDPMFLDAVVGAEYGTFPSVVASQGKHMQGETDLGDIIKFQVIVVNDVWKVIPGETGDEAKDFFKVSHDGEVTTEGEDIQEALQDAKDNGYNKASIKKYADVIVIITECEKDPEWVGETVTLQLAPSSLHSWRALAGRTKMKAARGLLKTLPVEGSDIDDTAVEFISEAQATTWKGNNFTKFVFSV